MDICDKLWPTTSRKAFLNTPDHIRSYRTTETCAILFSGNNKLETHNYILDLDILGANGYLLHHLNTYCVTSLAFFYTWNSYKIRQKFVWKYIFIQNLAFCILKATNASGWKLFSIAHDENFFVLVCVAGQFNAGHSLSKHMEIHKTKDTNLVNILIFQFLQKNLIHLTFSYFLLKLSIVAHNILYFLFLQGTWMYFLCMSLCVC